MQTDAGSYRGTPPPPHFTPTSPPLHTQLNPTTPTAPSPKVSSAEDERNTSRGILPWSSTNYWDRKEVVEVCPDSDHNLFVFLQKITKWVLWPWLLCLDPICSGTVTIENSMTTGTVTIENSMTTGTMMIENSMTTSLLEGFYLKNVSCFMLVRSDSPSVGCLTFCYHFWTLF